VLVHHIGHHKLRPMGVIGSFAYGRVRSGVPPQHDVPGMAGATAVMLSIPITRRILNLWVFINGSPLQLGVFKTGSFSPWPVASFFLTATSTGLAGKKKETAHPWSIIDRWRNLFLVNPAILISQDQNPQLCAPRLPWVYPFGNSTNLTFMYAYRTKRA